MLIEFVLVYSAFVHSDNGYIEDRSHNFESTSIDERTQVYSAQSFLVVTHPSTNRGRHALTVINVPLSFSIGRHCRMLSVDIPIMIERLPIRY